MTVVERKAVLHVDKDGISSSVIYPAQFRRNKKDWRNMDFMTTRHSKDWWQRTVWDYDGNRFTFFARCLKVLDFRCDDYFGGAACTQS